MSWTSMFKWATFREILLPSSGDFKRYFYHWQILERYFSHHQDTSPIIEILLSTFFGHFTSLKTLNIKIFKKFNKTPGDIIILQICAINENHMMCGSWDMECDWENVLSFWTVFCPFTTQKIKILQKWKKKIPQNIILRKCTKNHDHMLHCSWDPTHDRCNFYFSFWTNFCPFTPLA